MPILNRGLLNSTALTNVALLSAGFMLVSAPAMALNQNALPTGGQVIGGQATITQSGSTLNVTQQTNNAAINWQSFSIGSAATTNFFQPSANSIAVNRVTGVDPSQIEGHLNANGQVVLVNPNGVLFSKSARVDVGGLVASTSGITEQNAIDGKLVFDQGSNPNAKVVNEGHISAKDGGLVALVSPTVINNGVITAKLGKVSLAAGNKWTLDLYGDNLVNFALNDKVVGEVKNAGLISADGGAVQITANVAKDVVSNAINMTGVVEANSVLQKGGTILLEADGGSVDVSGKLAATGTTGGTIKVTGNSVTLDGATVDASGVNGGGTIDIGGESHGGGTLAHANTVTANASTKLVADATKTGTGGSISVWSDGATKFAGSATAKSKSGKGGTIETSGHVLTIDNAQVNLSGAAGNGSWLLDPFDLTINQGGAAAIEQGLSSGNVFIETTATGVDAVTSAGSTGTTSTGSLNGATVSTGTGNINVDSNITWSSANSLVLSAYDSVNVNASIVDSGTGNITLRADNAGRGGTVAGQVTFTGSDTKTQGAISLYYDDANYAKPVSYSSVATADNGVSAYMLVDSAADLARINTNLAGTYALGKDLTLTGKFVPIGSAATPFTGVFDGNGGVGVDYSINSLNVGVSGAVDVGLFADNAGIIRNTNLNNVTVYGFENLGALAGVNSGTLLSDTVTGLTVNSDANSQNVGGFVGENNAQGVLIGDSVTGSIKAGAGSTNVGGFAGYNAGSLTSNDAVIPVSAGNSSVNVGGYIGLNQNATISNVSVSNSVNVGAYSLNVGGLVGYNEHGSLLNDTVTADVVTGQLSGSVGGEVGLNSGVVSGAHITGLVSVSGNTNYIGGVIGANYGNVSGSSFSGTVIAGCEYVGGFVGGNFATVTNSTSTGLVYNTGGGDVGGFGGMNAGLLSNDSAINIRVVADSKKIGGFVGENTVSASIINSTATGTVIASNLGYGVGGFGGYNSGTINGAGFNGSVTAGNNSSDVGGGVGFNDSRGYVSNISVSASVVSGSNSTAVGGIVGLNGSDQINHSGSFGNVAATINTGSFDGTVSVGNDSFAVGGLAGWNSIWTGQGTAEAGVLSGLTATGLVTAAAGGGTTYIHNINQVGCEEVGGNCFGVAGKEVITVTPNSLTTTYGQAQNLTYGLSYTAPGGTANGLESGDQAANVLQVSLQSSQTNAGSSKITGSANINPNNANALLDYSIVFNNTNSTVTVDKAALTVTANGSQTYGGTNKVISYTYTGLVNGNTSGVVTGVSYTTPVTSLSNAGTYGITAAGGTAQNYTIVDATGVYTVNKAALTVAANGSQTYGGANKVISYTYTGLVNGNTSGVVTGVSYTTPVTSLSNAGTYGITATGGTAQNYTITDASGVYTVNKAGLTVTANGSQTYGGANKTISYTYAGLVNGNTSSVVTGVSYTTPVTSSTNVGTYGITATGGTAQNYTITDATGVYTVNKAAITVTASGSQTYGGSNMQVSYTYTGLPNGSTSGLVTGVSYMTSATSLSNAGTYNIMAEGGTAQNYTIVDATGVYTVNKAALTIAASGSQTYGGANKAISYTYTGLVNGNASGVVTGVSYTTPVTSSSNAGTYGITATGGTAQNYTITDASGVYTVNKAGLTVSATGSQTYGGANKTVSYTYTGLVNGNTSGVVTGVSYTTPVTSSSNAGTYGITATGGTAQNYTIVDATGVYTVNKAGLTVSATGSQTYGGANKTVSYTYTGLVNGNTSGVVTGVSYTTPVTSSSNAGTYGITATGGTAQNYTIVDATGVYTVNKAGLTVTANGSQTYGGSNMQVGYTYTGLVNGNTSGVVTGVSYTTPVTSASNAGTYGITATGGTAQNYTITDATGVYTVNKAGLTIAANGSQTYGGANKTVSYIYTGLVNGNTSGVVTGVSYTTPVTSSSNAGTYGITAAGGTAQNYTITDATGVYTVNKAGLTIGVTGSQTYGGTNQTVSYTYTGLVNGNTSGVVTGVSYTTPVTSSSNAGTYGITATGGTAQNYTITDGSGIYTVNKAPLTIGVTGTQTYGGTNPTVTYTYTGLVNGNTSGVVTGVSYTTPATSSSNVGTYTITETGGTAQNYTVSPAAPGAFNVTPASLTVSANDTTRTQGTNTPAFSATFAGLVNGDASSVVTGLTFTPGDTSGLTQGTYTNLIDVSGGMAHNYTITYDEGTLTVLAAGTTGGITPITPPTVPGQVETVTGQISGLNSLLETFNLASNNQVNCLKVNSEVRGVTTDSPIDCAAPLQVNGF